MTIKNVIVIKINELHRQYMASGDARTLKQMITLEKLLKSSK